MSLPLGIRLLPTVPFALGCWQVYRYQWKQELKRYRKARVEAPITQLPSSLQYTDDQYLRVIEELDFRRVQVAGHFDRDALELAPRKHPDRDELGSHLIQRFVLDDGTAVMVNRGFLPDVQYMRLPAGRQAAATASGARPGTPEGQAAADRADQQNMELVETLLNAPTAHATVRGFVRTMHSLPRAKASQPWYAPSRPGPQAKARTVDIDRMGELLRCAPVYIESLEESGAARAELGERGRLGTYPMPNFTIVELRDQHLGYVATWWTLAAAMTVFLRKAAPRAIK